MNTLNVKLDKMYQLKFDNAALYHLDKELGRSAVSFLMADATNLLSYEFTAAAFRAGMLWENPRLTTEEVLNMMPPFASDEMKQAREILTNALISALGLDVEDDDEAAEEADGKGKKKKPTGAGITP